MSMGRGWCPLTVTSRTGPARKSASEATQGELAGDGERDACAVVAMLERPALVHLFRAIRDAAAGALTPHTAQS